MQRSNLRLSFSVLALLAVALGLVGVERAVGQQPAAATANDAAGAASAASKSRNSIGAPPGDLTPAPGEHPLAPIVRWGEAGIEAIRKVNDYTCSLVKRERVDGQLNRLQQMDLKIRQQPFSIYASFPRRSGPPSQEVIYVEGLNNNRLWAHSDRMRLVGTVSLYPDSRHAMKDTRYPLTEAGVLNLVVRLVERAKNDLKYDECDVKVFPDATINGRPTLCLTVTHPTQREYFTFHQARVFIDREWNVPVRYEAYWWPTEPGGKPILLEEYTYLDFQFNVGLTEADFDIRNPNYFFPAEVKQEEVLLAEEADRAKKEGRKSEVAAAPRRASEPLDTDLRKSGSSPSDVAATLPAAEPATPDAHETLRPSTGANPLSGVITLAETAKAELAKIDDYTCVVAARERAPEGLSDYEYTAVKIRHEPFSVYYRTLGPARPEGQELIYVAGYNDGKVIAHDAGFRGDLLGTVRLAPDNPFLRGRSRHPITEAGLKMLVDRQLERCQQESIYGETQVQLVEGAKVNGRSTTCAQIVHPVKRDHFRFFVTRLYFDDVWKVPIRFEGYSWPTDRGQEPVLEEEYTFQDLKWDVGLSDRDFDPANPDYEFGPERSGQTGPASPVAAAGSTAGSPMAPSRP